MSEACVFRGAGAGVWNRLRCRSLESPGLFRCDFVELVPADFHASRRQIRAVLPDTVDEGGVREGDLPALVGFHHERQSFDGPLPNEFMALAHASDSAVA